MASAVSGQASSTPDTPGHPPSATGSNPSANPQSAPPLQTGKVNTNSAPILASGFSKEFHVFSAKKFPGVVDSTPISKSFAKQGIKIPIRKDAGGVRGNERREWMEGDD